MCGLDIEYDLIDKNKIVNPPKIFYLHRFIIGHAMDFKYDYYNDVWKKNEKCKRISNGFLNNIFDSVILKT